MLESLQAIWRLNNGLHLFRRGFCRNLTKFPMTATAAFSTFMRGSFHTCIVEFPYLQILTELTGLYGPSCYSMRDIYSRLQTQPFPSLGETLEIVAAKKQRRMQESIHSSQLSNIATRIKRIKRPIDFRLDGTSICQMLTLDQLLMVYATVLQEHKLIVVSSSLR